MCLIVVACRAHPQFPLVVIANRDEFYERPTEPAAFWQDAPDILAGRDRREGGTWLGVTRSGRFAAVTNFRRGLEQRSDARSRGGLVSGYLFGDGSAEDYCAEVGLRAADYNGFNLIAGGINEIGYVSSEAPHAHLLADGIHGLSNHLLDTPWPKVERTKLAVAEILGREAFAAEQLLGVLADGNHPADAQLPDTGVGLELERKLSPVFIGSEDYGTRSSTVLTIRDDGLVTFMERSFGPEGVDLEARRYSFRIDPDARPVGLATVP